MQVCICNFVCIHVSFLVQIRLLSTNNTRLCHPVVGAQLWLVGLTALPLLGYRPDRLPAKSCATPCWHLHACLNHFPGSQSCVRLCVCLGLWLWLLERLSYFIYYLILLGGTCVGNLNRKNNKILQTKNIL